MPLQSNLAFIEPYNQAFQYLRARAVGRTQLDVLTEWVLDVRTSNLSLKHSAGEAIPIGVVSKVVLRCALAFLRFTTPYIVLEYLDNTKAIFILDLQEEQPSLRSLDVDLSSYRDITLTYWRSMHKDKLIVTAIKEDGIYSGTLDEKNNLVMELFNRVEVNEPRRAIHRVGVNTANQLQTEIVDIVINQ